MFCPCGHCILVWYIPSRHVLRMPSDVCSMGGLPVVKWHSGRFYRAGTLERILKGGVGVVAAVTVSAMLRRPGGSSSDPTIC